VFIEVSQTPNQNSQQDRAEDNQKERDFRYLEELIIRKRGEAKPNDDLLRVLQEEKDADDQDHQ
jgi:cytochrome P450